MNKILVIGDYTLDVLISNSGSGDELCLPAEIDVIPGGVGRNIALNLQNLGADVVLVTAYADTAAGAILEKDSRENNLCVRNIAGRRMNVFCAELDASGQVSKAFYDIATLEQIETEDLLSVIKEVRPECVVLDANLLPAQLEKLSRWCVENSVHYALEAVSAPKAHRIAGVINGCLLVKFNQYELCSFLGGAEKSVEKMLGDVDGIVKNGARNVVVSLGASGSIFSDGETKYFPSQTVSVVNENGAGDAMFATALLAILQGEPMKRVARLAIAAAEKTCMVKQAVCRKLNREELWQIE